MKSPFLNGGMIGKTLDFGDPNSFIVGNTTASDTLVYVGGQTVAFTGTTNDSTINFNLTGGIATTPAANDLVLMVYAVGSNSSINPTTTITTGYTSQASFTSGSQQSVDVLIARKVMGAVPDTSFTRSGTGNTQHAGAIAIQVWRNVDTASPLDTAIVSRSQGFTVLPDPNAVTPSTANAVVIVAAGAGHLQSANTFGAATLSNFVTVGSADNVDTTVGMGSYAWTSGSYNPDAWTFTGANSAAYATISYTFAIKPRTVTVPIFANRKNSGVWNLEAVYEHLRSQYTSPSQLDLNVPGTTFFEVPPGITQISAVCIGGGGGGAGGEGGRGETNGGGGGGALSYGTFAVTPGELLTATVGAGGAAGAAGGNNGGAGQPSTLSRGATVLLSGGGGAAGSERNEGVTAAGGTSSGTERDGGGNGGNGGTGSAASGGTGGGGAGGFLGNGGNGGTRTSAGSPGTGGGAGGGGGVSTAGDGLIAGCGGGVGYFGTEFGNPSGAGGTIDGGPGGGGNFGEDGGYDLAGAFGGGGGGADDTNTAGATGARGAVRLIWGENRFYPGTNTDGIF